jgi:hypothetical protein
LEANYPSGHPRRKERKYATGRPERIKDRKCATCMQKDWIRSCMDAD